MLQVFAWLLLGSLGLVVISAYIFVVYGLNFEEPGMEQVWEAGFQEHTFVIEQTTINYVEGPDNGLPLLLIHGQLGLW
jgi:hypothetical protein